MKPLSKLFYFGLIVVGILITLPLLIFLAALYSLAGGGNRQLIPFLVLPAMLPLMLLTAISLGTLVYKMWAAIQVGGPPPRTTPVVAVLLLFIPCFNLYWVFQAHWGWTKDFNEYVAQRGISAPRMPEQLTLTICILQLLAILPLVGVCLAPINYVLVLIFMNSAIDGVNAVLVASPNTTT